MPGSADEILRWPQVLLDRCCELWGEDVIKNKLRFLPNFQNHHTPALYWLTLGLMFFKLTQGCVRWRVFSLCSGIECLGEALLILDAACAWRWGFQLQAEHCLMVTGLQISNIVNVSCLLILSLYDTYVGYHSFNQACWSNTSALKGKYLVIFTYNLIYKYIYLYKGWGVVAKEKHISSKNSFLSLIYHIFS